jgi:1,4-alpha-glucan branching enzyme
MAKKDKGDKGTIAQGFSYTAPTAMSVVLVGDFTHWQKSPIPLRKEADGVWRTQVDLEPGTHRYRFLVDGQWRDDPECTVRVPSPYGSEDMVREVR